jgi:hypothetical protein
VKSIPDHSRSSVPLKSTSTWNLDRPARSDDPSLAPPLQQRRQPGEVRIVLTEVAIPEPLRLSKPYYIRIIDKARRGGVQGFGTTRLLGSLARVAKGSDEDHRKHIARGRRSKKGSPFLVSRPSP